MRCEGWLCVSGVLLLSAPSARASGFATARFGGEHGHPTATNPTAIYYNPAAIAQSDGTHVFVEGMFVLRRASYAHELAPTDVPEPADAQGANNGETSLTNVAAVPMLGATTKIGQLALGAGFYVPFGGGETWGKNHDFENDPRYPGPVDGVQRWYSIEGEIQSTYITLAAAYAIGDTGLSVGVSGNLIYSVIDTTTARTALGNDDVKVEGRSHLNVSGWQYGFGVGLLYEAIARKLWLGASYQSRPNVSGGMVLEGELTNNFSGNVKSTEVDLHQDLPDVIRAGMRYRPDPNLELRLFGDVTRWSAFDNQCVSRKDEPCEVKPDGSNAAGSGAIQNVPRHWDDAFGIRVGLSSWVEPELELFTGFGYDSNAVPDETLEPSLMDYDDFAWAVGARYEISSHLFVAASYTEFEEIPRDTSGKSEHPKKLSPSNEPDSGGNYAEWVGLVNLNLEAVF